MSTNTRTLAPTLSTSFTFLTKENAGIAGNN